MIQLYAMLKVHGSWISLVNQKETLNERVAQASVWHECELKYFDGKKIKTFYDLQEINGDGELKANIWNISSCISFKICFLKISQFFNFSRFKICILPISGMVQWKEIEFFSLSISTRLSPFGWRLLFAFNIKYTGICAFIRWRMNAKISHFTFSVQITIFSLRLIWNPILVKLDLWCREKKVKIHLESKPIPNRYQTEYFKIVLSKNDD